MDTDDFKINQLTKELVAAKLRSLQNPGEAAAELVRRTLEVALKNLKPGDAAESRIVADACQGAMTALLLNDQDLAQGAVAILGVVVDMAHSANADGPEMMMSALRGIADMRRFADADRMISIREAVEHKYQGAGLAFQKLCDEPLLDATPEKKPA